MQTIRGRAGRRDRSEFGITTAEYAVGTAAGAGFAGLLYKLLTGGSATSCSASSSTTCSLCSALADA